MNLATFSETMEKCLRFEYGEMLKNSLFQCWKIDSR